jgi:hypothetical protein
MDAMQQLELAISSTLVFVRRTQIAMITTDVPMTLVTQSTTNALTLLMIVFPLLQMADAPKDCRIPPPI